MTYKRLKTTTHLCLTDLLFHSGIVPLATMGGFIVGSGQTKYKNSFSYLSKDLDFGGAFVLFL